LWHDPNFGVRFDEILGTIERALEGQKLRFGAESTLSILTTERLARLQRAGFAAMLPGIESWFDYGAKLGLGRLRGQQKMEAVAQRINEVLSYIPYVQVNLIFGLDAEEDAEAFELTRDFVGRTPGAWPNFNLATAYGQASPLGEQLAAEGRILNVPFPLLDQKTCVNMIARRGSPAAPYRALVRVAEVAWGGRLMLRRALAARDWTSRLINVLRARGTEQRRRMRWYRRMVTWLETDCTFRSFFDGDTARVPVQLREAALRRIAPFSELLPPDIAQGLRTGWLPVADRPGSALGGAAR
jgi:hypothetical protein